MLDYVFCVVEIRSITFPFLHTLDTSMCFPPCHLEALKGLHTNSATTSSKNHIQSNSLDTHNQLHIRSDNPGTILHLGNNEIEQLRYCKQDEDKFTFSIMIFVLQYLVIVLLFSSFSSLSSSSFLPLAVEYVQTPHRQLKLQRIHWVLLDLSAACVLV